MRACSEYFTLLTSYFKPESQDRHTYDFPHPAVSVDLVAFSIEEGSLNILLIKRLTSPFNGKWTLPGGFVRNDESLEFSAARVLNDKARISDAYTEQLYTFAAPKRDTRDRVISIAYFTILKRGYNYNGSGKWRNVEELSKFDFDHNEIAEIAVERLRSKLTYSDQALEFMPDECTLAELRSMWETRLQRPWISVIFATRW